MIHLDILPEIIFGKKIDVMKIIYVPTIIETCMTNLNYLFRAILNSKITRYKYIDIVIDFRLNIINDDIVFDKFIVLITLLEEILIKERVSILRINHKLIHLNTNWKNDLYYHFLF